MKTNDKLNEKRNELRSIIHEVIWQYCYGKGDSDALFNYTDIGEAANGIVELYFQSEAVLESEQTEEITDQNVRHY